MSDVNDDRGETIGAEDVNEKKDNGETSAADDVRHAHEGNAHADYTETGEETRAATLKSAQRSSAKIAARLPLDTRPMLADPLPGFLGRLAPSGSSNSATLAVTSSAGAVRDWPSVRARTAQQRG